MSGIFENTLCSIPFQGNYLATASATANTLDLAQTAALIEREGLRFDGTNYVVFSPANPWSSSGFEYVFEISTTSSGAVFTGAIGSLVVYWDATTITVNHQGVTAGCAFTLNSSGLTPSVIAINYDGFGYRVLQNGAECLISILYTGTSTGNRWNYTTAITQPTSRLGNDLGSIFYNGVISRFSIFNYALTAGERTSLIGRGLVTLPEQRGGSMTALNTSSLIITEAPTSGFLSTSSTAATRNSSADSYWSGYALGLTAKVGQRFRVSMTVTNWQTSSENGVRLGVGIGGPNLSDIYQVTANGAVSFVLTATSNTATHLNFKRVKFDYSGLSIIPLGTFFEQDSGQRNAGYTVLDTSGNNADIILPASGVSVIDPAMRGVIRFTTNTSGNQQIGGSQVIIPTNARISSWVINANGTPNVTLGNASGGAQYRASAAVVAGGNQITLLTPFTPTGSLWCNSSTTATLKHTIQWEYIQ
jgi:hypothetical protein